MKTVLKNITNISEATLRDKVAILRVDYNIPDNDLSRIIASKNTIDFLLKSGATPVIISHYKDPKGYDPSCSLAHILDKIQSVIGQVNFIDNIEYLQNNDNIQNNIDNNIKSNNIKIEHGKINLLENIRFLSGEKEASTELAKNLAKIGDIYINEAFSVSHRNHCSISQIAKILPSFAGIKLQNEIDQLNIIHNCQKLYAIFGGAKVMTKVNAISSIKCQSILLGGLMANTYLKASGYNVGNSLYSSEAMAKMQAIIHNKDSKNHNTGHTDHDTDHYVSIHNIHDVVCSEHNTCSIQDLPDTEQILDIGYQTIDTFFQNINEQDAIIWNGPLGLYEDGYIHGSYRALSHIKQIGCHAFIGGGDIGEVINKEKLHNAYISTGGGAMLEFIAKGHNMPGIQPLVSHI